MCVCFVVVAVVLGLRIRVQEILRNPASWHICQQMHIEIRGKDEVSGQMWRFTPFRIVSQLQGHDEISARAKGRFVTVGTEGTSQRSCTTKLHRNTRGALAYINTHQPETCEEIHGRQQVRVNVTLTSRTRKHAKYIQMPNFIDKLELNRYFQL